MIEPDAGLTVLVGPNNCGKSAFVSALQILCHNAKSNYVLRHGESQCEIIVETDDGHIVTWSKKKSGSPKYVINGEEFDRLRQGIPQELHDILGLSKVTCEKDQFDIHFGEQKSPVFLLNDSGKAAAQFFASSSDAIRLVEMQDRHKGKVRDAKRDLSRLSDEKKQLIEDLESLEPLDELEAKLNQCEANFKTINNNIEQIEQIQILIQAIEHAHLTLEKQEAVDDCLKSLAEPPVLADTLTLDCLIGNLTKATIEHQFTTAFLKAFFTFAAPPVIQDASSLTSTINDLLRCQRRLEFHHESTASLGKLVAPPKTENELALSDLISCFGSALQKLATVDEQANRLALLQPTPKMDDAHPLESLLQEITKAEKRVLSSNSSLQTLESELDELEVEVESWVQENPTCPTCGSETAVEQLIGSGIESGKGHRHG